MTLSPLVDTVYDVEPAPPLMAEKRRPLLANALFAGRLPANKAIWFGDNPDEVLELPGLILVSKLII